ncbi:hypothetical protein T08_10404 [Trichinella sp. T8]|nr:hypothetical protein T08_10404 [Trichinella sp. T8]
MGEKNYSLIFYLDIVLYFSFAEIVMDTAFWTGRR